MNVNAPLRTLLAGILLPACLLLAGCPEKGPVESTGDAVEDVVEDAGDALGESADSVQDTAEDATGD